MTGRRKEVREEEIERKKDQHDKMIYSLEELKGRNEKLEKEVENEGKMKHISRLLYAGEIIERAGLLYTFKEENLYKVLIDNRTKIQKIAM